MHNREALRSSLSLFDTTCSFLYFDVGDGMVTFFVFSFFGVMQGTQTKA